MYQQQNKTNNNDNNDNKKAEISEAEFIAVG